MTNTSTPPLTNVDLAALVREAAERHGLGAEQAAALDGEIKKRAVKTQHRATYIGSLGAYERAATELEAHTDEPRKFLDEYLVSLPASGVSLLEQRFQIGKYEPAPISFLDSPTLGERLFYEEA